MFHLCTYTILKNSFRSSLNPKQKKTKQKKTFRLISLGVVQNRFLIKFLTKLWLSDDTGVWKNGISVHQLRFLCSILTFWLFKMSWEAWGLTSTGQGGTHGGGQARDPTQRHQWGGDAAVSHPATEVQLLGGQQRLQDAHQAESRAAFGNEVHLVSVWAEIRRNLMERPWPGTEDRKTSSWLFHENVSFILIKIWMILAVKSLTIIFMWGNLYYKITKSLYFPRMRYKWVYHHFF